MIKGYLLLCFDKAGELMCAKHERGRAKGAFRERLNPNAEEIGWPGEGIPLAQRALTITPWVVRARIHKEGHPNP